MDARTQSRERDSLVGLIAGLREDVRNLFREGVRLAKTEVTEKAVRLGRNAMPLAIGGVISLLAVVCLLLAVGFIIAYGFESLGMSAGVALFLGFLIIGLVAGAIGGMLVGKALSSFSSESLVPDKTIATLREIKEGGAEQVPACEHSRTSKLNAVY